MLAQGPVFIDIKNIFDIIYLTRQLEKIDEAYPLRENQLIKKIIALTFPEAGRLFFMRKIQNGDKYINRG